MMLQRAVASMTVIPYMLVIQEPARSLNFALLWCLCRSLHEQGSQLHRLWNAEYGIVHLRCLRKAALP